ncbi:MAG: lysophospholipid acyltransferase family protein [Acidimicrobiales bacterium]
MADDDPTSDTDDGISIEAGRAPGWLQDPLRKPITALVRRLWDFTIEGIENVPTEGPVLLTPNHLSFIDSPFVMALSPRRTLAVGKGEYMNSWKTKHVFPAFGMVPIDRSGGQAAVDTLNNVAGWLGAGEAFLIYPEGTRTRDGYLHRGRTGAVRLALRTGAPIVPVGLIGTDEIQPIDTVLPKFGAPCTVRFGEAIDVAARSGGQDNRRMLRSLTDELMYEISELSEQAYSDTYGDEEPEPLSA